MTLHEPDGPPFGARKSRLPKVPDETRNAAIVFFLGRQIGQPTVAAGREENDQEHDQPGDQHGGEHRPVKSGAEGADALRWSSAFLLISGRKYSPDSAEQQAWKAVSPCHPA